MIQQDASALLGLIDEMVAEFEQKTKISPEKYAEIYEAFQSSFQAFIEGKRLQLAEIVYTSELEKSEKMYFIYLLFNDLFDYTQYQLLQRKFDEMIKDLEKTEKDLQTKISRLEEQQKALEQSIYTNTRKAHKDFTEKQSDIVESGIKKVETNKKHQEASQMQAIKQKLKKHK